MSSEQRQFSRQQLLDALEQGWKQYLSRLAALPKEEQVQFAQRQGFPRVQDVLAHIIGWWELSMRRTVRVLTGPPVIQPEDDVLFPESMDEFNAETITHYYHWTSAAVEEKFVATLVVLEQFLLNLPEMALEDERIQRWMRSEAMDHYQDHCLPKASNVG
jgi:hypothetical protein